MVCTVLFDEVILDGAHDRRGRPRTLASLTAQFPVLEIGGIATTPAHELRVFQRCTKRLRDGRSFHNALHVVMGLEAQLDEPINVVDEDQG